VRAYLLVGLFGLVTNLLIAQTYGSGAELAAVGASLSAGLVVWARVRLNQGA
jgi:hypothetical protein